MNYKKGPIIGRGSTATVSLDTTTTTTTSTSVAGGNYIAVKSANFSTSKFLQNEQQIISKLKSPHVIEYLGYDIDIIDNIPSYNLLMEYAANGSISDVIKKHKQLCLNECLIRSYTYQILLGLDYIHSNNLIHCDIKCDNILVCNNGLKISDFGCAKFMDSNTAAVFSGTPVFMAPEVARGEEQGFAADVWAVGCAVIEMATGCNPWPEIKDPVSALYRIGYSGDVPVFPAWFSDDGKDFLNKCVRINRDERWTVKELLKHPFVSNLNPGFEKIETFSKRSPSSILDRGFWDSFESLDSSKRLSVESVLSESPGGRILRLVEESGSSLPNWGDEGDWIAVRVNHDDEISKIFELDEYTYVDVEEGYTESTRSDTFLLSDFCSEEDVSRSIRTMLESYIVEKIEGNVFVSRFVNNDNCLHDNSKLRFKLLGYLFY